MNFGLNFYYVYVQNPTIISHQRNNGLQMVYDIDCTFLNLPLCFVTLSVGSMVVILKAKPFSLFQVINE